jgi:hypothetical protein
MTTAIRERAEQRHSLQRLAARLAEIYRSVLAERTGNGHDAAATGSEKVV